ncbi:MAG: UDP-glucose 4-epimerase GalE [Oscillospiraceae bacterium]|nr:UDP-glucose 4-epimerase GalE [Oscillospiraceae bacterium]
MKILVTGGAGYIGSHTCVELLNAGYEVVIVDNFSNSKPEVLNRIREITGKDFAFYQYDVADKDNMRKIFEENCPDAVIHFAGYKAVGESVEKPLMYYQNNLGSTFTLCELMNEYNVKKLVFSSSATVYGVPKTVPIREDFPLSTTNPYGATKLMQEDIFRDIAFSDSDWSIALLRYFNPIGAHKSGRIGEDPNGIPNNLMPYISQVAIGKRECLSVFGDDYDTEDGTGVRDYIHVVDLALGHLKAVEKVLRDKGIGAYNLGTGNGYSVLQMVKAFEKACGKSVNYKIAPRRSGDVAMCYADPAYAKEQLQWQAVRELEEMCEDTWRWQKNNPNGYDK